MHVGLRLAGEIHAIAPNHFHGEAAEMARLCLLDGLIAVAAGAETDVAHAMRQYISSAFGYQGNAVEGGFYAWPQDRMTYGPEAAALLAGVYASAFDFGHSDMTTVSHPGTVIVPAIIVGSQWGQASGLDVLMALASGYEAMRYICSRLGQSDGQYRLQDRGMRPTAVAGVSGAIAALSRLLRLDLQRTANALSIGCNYSFGLRANPLGGMSVTRIQAGWAARSGVSAILQDRHGIEAGEAILDDRLGIAMALSGPHGPLPEARAPKFSEFRSFANVRFKANATPVVWDNFLSQLLEHVRTMGLKADSIRRVLIQVPETVWELVQPLSGGGRSVAGPEERMRGDIRLCTAAILHYCQPLTPRLLRDASREKQVELLADRIEAVCASADERPDRDTLEWDVELQDVVGRTRILSFADYGPPSTADMTLSAVSERWCPPDSSADWTHTVSRLMALTGKIEDAPDFGRALRSALDG